MMHLMADISDRRDVFLLWNTFLKLCAIAIPCQKCQKHMAEYWSTVRFVPRKWEHMTAEETRNVIRLRIHEFHNAVNDRLGKPSPALAPLAESLDRGAICREIRGIFEGLKAEWQAVHIDWKRHTAVLIQLLCCGPM
jgi:hypothetical protein